MGPMKLRRFQAYAAFLVGFNVLVILWGALVRATGSGAGCGKHWPLCNGQIIPQPEQTATVIELIHRLSTSLDGLLVIGLFIWARYLFPKQHLARVAAGWSLVFIIVEGLIGAGLVRLELVADNDSLARGWWIAGHLANTLILLAWLTLSWLGVARPKLRLQVDRRLRLPAIGLIGMVVLGMSGAIAALGDTLFPDTDLMSGLAQDFSAQAHVLVRLRLWHPIIAVGVGLCWIVLASREANSPTPLLNLAARLLLTSLLAQLAAGLLNLVLLAPIWLQLIHLLLADLVWISAVAFTFVLGTQSKLAATSAFEARPLSAQPQN